MLSSKLLLLTLCFGVVLTRWERNNASIESLEVQITNLQRQLQGYDELKEKIDRDEIAIGWNNQHVSELNDRREELSSSLAHMSEAFKRGAHNLKDNNKEMSRALSALHDHNVKLREQDMQTIHQLEEESVNAHVKVNHEHAENVVLKEILDDMRSLLNKAAGGSGKERLRGA